MKRLALLLLLPLAGGVLFAQTTYSIAGTVPNGTVGVSYSASLQTNPQAYAAWSYTGSLPPGLSMTTGSSYVATISGTPTCASASARSARAAVVVARTPATTRTIATTAASPIRRIRTYVDLNMMSSSEPENIRACLKRYWRFQLPTSSMKV